MTIFAVRDIIFSNGTIGFFHDWFVGPFSGMISSYGFSGFQLYDLTLGNKIYPSDWMFRLSILPFSFLGGELVSKFILVFFCSLSGFSMFYLSRTIRLSYFSSFLAGLIYLFSPIVFTRAIAGHGYYLLGYALTPLLVASFMKAQKDVKRRLTFSIMCGLIFALIGTQIQFFVMGFVILLTLSTIHYESFKSNLIILTIAIAICLLFHLPWVLPILFTNSASSFSAQSFLSYHEITSSPTLLESLRVIGYNIQPYSYTQLVAKGIIPQIVLYTNFLMPIIAFFSLFLKRNKYTVTFSVIAILGIFLSKGISPPFENIFIIAFQYTPLVIFRELWHIAFLVFFSYTILISIFVDELSALCKISERISKKAKQIKFSAIGLVFVIIISNGYPLFLGNMAGYMQTYSLDSSYDDLFTSFQDDENNYRIFWLPSLTPITYNNKTLSGADPLISYSPKPTFPQSVNLESQMSKLNMFLTSTITENKTQLIGNLLSPYATKYLISRNDFKSQYPYYTSLGLYPELAEMWSNNSTIYFLETQDDLILENDTENFKLYQNPKSAEFIYAPTRIVYGQKDLSILNQLSKLLDLTDVGYITDFSKLVTSNPLFIINNGLDLIPIITGTKIEPGNYATETDAQKGWINSKNWFWYDYAFASSLNNGAFTKTKSQLNVPIEINNTSEIWIKLLKNPYGGTLTMTLNNENETTINTLSTTSMLEWIKIYDNLPEQSSMITFSNSDAEIYIDEILITTEIQTEQIGPILQNSTIIYALEPTDMEPSSLITLSPHEESACESWSLSATGFYADFDDQPMDGKLVKVTTNTTSSSWSWITSPETPVIPNCSYFVVTEVKQENAKATHVVIEGFNSTLNTWTQLVQVPAGQDGSFDWTTYKSLLTFDEQITKLRLVLNAGWVFNESAGNATSWFRNLSITPKYVSNDFVLTSNSSISKNLQILKDGTYNFAVEFSGEIQINFSNQSFSVFSDKCDLVNIGSLFLRKGNYSISIKALEDSQICGIWSYTSPDQNSLKQIFKSGVSDAQVLEYKQLSSTNWEVTVNCSSPFLLSFAAPYDSNWVAQISDKKYVAIPNDGYINAFYINQTGLLQITIDYGPQKLFNIGLCISIITLITCVTFLSYKPLKNTNLWIKMTEIINKNGKLSNKLKLKLSK